MKNNKYICLIIGCISIFLFQKVNAADVRLYVGDNTLIVAPTPPQGAIYNTAWDDLGNSEFRLVKNSDKYSATIYMDYQFSGTKYFSCTVYYYWDQYGRQYTSTKTYTYSIECLGIKPGGGTGGGGTGGGGVESNHVRFINSEIELKEGQVATLQVRSDNTISDFKWYSSNSKIASVTVNPNNSFYATVKAVSEGETYINATQLEESIRCHIIVRSSYVAANSVTIPSTVDIDADASKNLSASVLPSDATINSKKWYIESGSEYISLTSSGTLTGIKPGTAKIYCVVNGSVTSNKATVTVKEPSFNMTSTSPSDNTTGQNVFINPFVTYSLALYEGNNFPSISLKNASTDASVDGKASISGKTITFIPAKPLEPQTDYILTIPANAVKNKWGTHYSSAVNINFKTGDYEKLILKTSVTDKFLSKGDKISLTASKSSVKIYYTLNGSMPTKNSTLYTGDIIFEKDIKLRAMAVGDGYESSEILSMDYYLTNVEVTGQYPDADTQLFVCEDVNPSLTFSNKIEPSDNIRNVSVLKNDKEAIDGEVIVADSTIYFIPKEPFELGCYYKVSVPQNAIVTWLGEANEATSWTFNTGDFVTAIALGNEASAAIKTDGSLLTWGEIFKSGNSSDGSYVNETKLTPESFVSSEVRYVSAGYMHNAIIKMDGSLWMWGRQYCGEFGNNSTVGSVQPIKIMDNVKEVSCGGQTTAIVKTDGSLWMVGRNDFGQIGDSTIVVRKSPVKIMDDVRMVVAGWCSSYAVKTDGTLCAWGRNDRGQLGNGALSDQLKPVVVMDNVKSVAASNTESNVAAAIRTDGSLWVWGDGNGTPHKILNDVCNVDVCAAHIVAVKNDGSLWKYTNDVTERIAEGISDVQVNASSISVLKTDGSVWTGSLATPTEKKLIDGRVSSELSGLNLNRNTMILTEGCKSVLVAKPIAINADYSSLSWVSSNDNVVEVSDRGVVLSKAIGSADIVVTIKDTKGNEFSEICHVLSIDGNSMLPGDVNSDNHVDCQDAVLIMRYFLGKLGNEQINIKAADVNHDGKITMSDANAIINMSIQK